MFRLRAELKLLNLQIVSKPILFDLDKHFSQLNNEEETIFAYRGAISTEFINNTLFLVEAKLNDIIQKSSTRKKVYNVLVESLQNLFHHVDSPLGDLYGKGESYGLFLLSKNGVGYKITTGNFIRNERIPQLREKLEKINSLTKEELKDFYKFVLNNQEFSAKGGGGLGLIDIARKTGSKLVYTFEPYDENFHFFDFSVVIPEEEQ